MFIETYLKKKDFFIINPRTHSFGGVLVSLFEGLKISKFSKKKILLCVPLINTHSKHKKKKIYGLNLIYNLFLKLPLKQKIISVILSIIINLNLSLKLIKIRGLFSMIFGLKKINKILPLQIGFNYSKNNYFDTNSQIWKEILKNKIEFKLPKKNSYYKDKFIALHIKDWSHSEINEITNEAVSDIENCKKSIEYLTQNNFKVVRIGNKFSKKFDFKNDFFYDSTLSDCSLPHQYLNYANCEFFFGSSTPGCAVAEFFDKKKLIINSPDQWWNNGQSFNKNNFILFKKIFSYKEDRILSLEEILSDQSLLVDGFKTVRKSKDLIYIDNSPQEILDIVKSYINLNYNQEREDESLLQQYLDLRLKNINNFLRDKNNIEHHPRYYEVKMYKYAEINIPSSFLKNYLFQSSELIEQSSKAKKEKINFL